MIAPAKRRAAAAALIDARKTRAPIEPLTETWPGLDVDDAYAVQSIQIDQRRSEGAAVVGWKVGLTSVAMQRQLGVDEPDFGPLLDDMEAPAGGTIEAGEMISPRAEAELAFRLGADLVGPDVDLETAVAAVDGVLPALEIIDSRIVDWRITLADTIADHASCGRFVLGEGIAPLGAVDIESVGVSVLVNGKVVERGFGRAVLGNPLRAVVWLANTIAPYGTSLRAGEVILAGALHASVPLRAGDAIEARYTDPALRSTSIQCRPTEAEPR